MFKEMFTESTVKVGQIWMQNKGNKNKPKDVIEIITLNGSSSADVKSSEKNKVLSLSTGYIQKNFILSKDVD